MKFFLFFLIIFCIFVSYLVYNKTLFSITLEEMKYCEFDSDCVPVGCVCTCSGCGGFSYEDIINKKYTNAWYYQKNCKPAEICPMVCCGPTKAVCENNMCVVKPIPYYS